MRREILGLLALVLLAGCDLPFGTSTAAPVPTDISPADATKVVNEFWKGRELAFTNVDGAPLDTVEADDLNAIDRGTLDVRVKLKKPGAPSARALGNVKVYAPHQKDYPAHFLATGEASPLDADLKQTGPPLTHLFLFVKKDPDTPYKATLMSVQAPDQSLPELAVDKDGFASLVPAEGQAATYKVSSDQLGPMLAQVLNAMKADRPPPSNAFAAGAFTTQEAADVKDLVNAEAQHGVQIKIDFSGPTTLANFAYQTKDGGSFALFKVNASVSIVTTAGSSGCVIFVPTRAEVARGVPPALLRALAYTAVGMGGAVVPKSSDQGKLITIPALTSGPTELNVAPCELLR